MVRLGRHTRTLSLSSAVALVVGLVIVLQWREPEQPEVRAEAALSDPRLERTAARSHAAGHSGDSGPEAPAPSESARLVRVRGRIVFREQVPDPAQAEDVPPPLDPLVLGISEKSVLASLSVRLREGGASTTSDESGVFLLESELPIQTRKVTLQMTSNLLMLAAGGDRLVLRLEPGDHVVDLDVEVPMTRAVVAQPRFKGRVIRPEDLSDPEVRAEFTRQMNEINNLVIPPPPGSQARAGADGLSASDRPVRR